MIGKALWLVKKAGYEEDMEDIRRAIESDEPLNFDANKGPKIYPQKNFKREATSGSEPKKIILPKDITLPKETIDKIHADTKKKSQKITDDYKKNNPGFFSKLKGSIRAPRSVAEYGAGALGLGALAAGATYMNSKKENDDLKKKAEEGQSGASTGALLGAGAGATWGGSSLLGDQTKTNEYVNKMKAKSGGMSHDTIKKLYHGTDIVKKTGGLAIAGAIAGKVFGGNKGEKTTTR